MLQSQKPASSNLQWKMNQLAHFTRGSSAPARAPAIMAKLLWSCSCNPRGRTYLLLWFGSPVALKGSMYKA